MASLTPLPPLILKGRRRSFAPANRARAPRIAGSPEPAPNRRRHRQCPARGRDGPIETPNDKQRRCTARLRMTSLRGRAHIRGQTLSETQTSAQRCDAASARDRERAGQHRSDTSDTAERKAPVRRARRSRSFRRAAQSRESPTGPAIVAIAPCFFSMRAHRGWPEPRFSATQTPRRAMSPPCVNDRPITVAKEHADVAVTPAIASAIGYVRSV